MTPDQRKRLGAVAAALAPCVGCLAEDEADADQELASLQPDRVGSIRAVLDSLRQKIGEAPVEWHTDEDEDDGIEARRAALRSQLEELARLRALLGKRGATASRGSCPACSRRKQHRCEIANLARTLHEQLQRKPEDDILDENADGG